MATYVEKTLASDEEIIYVGRFNWTFSFFPVLWFAIGAAPLVMQVLMEMGVGAAGDAEDLRRAGWWLSGIAAAVGSLILLNHVIILATTDIAVTTYRFVYKRGLISRRTQEVSLSKIEEITLHQTVWGRLFGYGQLVIRGTGVGVIELPDLDNPIQMRRVVENARSALRRDRGSEAFDDD